MHKLMLFLFALGCTTPPQPKNQAVVGIREAYQIEPCFITKYLIKVYCGTIEINRDDMEKATDLFVKYTEEFVGLNAQTIKSALAYSTVEWTTSLVYAQDHKITVMARGATLNRDVYVTWPGSISSSSLFHEWMHILVNHTVKTPDPNHQNLYWWRAVPRIQEKAKEAGL